MDMSIPGVWPLLFKYKKKLSDKVSAYVTLDSHKKLMKYLKFRPQIILPKHVLVRGNGSHLYFGPEYTMPSTRCLERHNFSLTELDSTYVITKSVKERSSAVDQENDNNEEPICNFNLFDETVEVVDTLMEQNESIHSCSAVSAQQCQDRNNTSVELTILSCDTFSTHYKECNIFRQPLKASNFDIVNLIHITKNQFITFVRKVKPFFQMKKDTFLDIYSKLFLFRVKLASNWSFKTLATCFGISLTHVRRIFWKCVRITYKHCLHLPNLLHSEDIEHLFEDSYNRMDPFYKTILSPFKDPKGRQDKLIRIQQDHYNPSGK